MARKVIYEPHPVSPERKAELRAQGYAIIDARFAPEGEKPVVAPVAAPVEVAPVEAPEAAPVEEVEAEAPKRGRPPKVAPEPQISDKAETSSGE
jgi:hypothetical protein